MELTSIWHLHFSPVDAQGDEEHGEEDQQQDKQDHVKDDQILVGRKGELDGHVAGDGSKDQPLDAHQRGEEVRPAARGAADRPEVEAVPLGGQAVFLL